MTPLFALVLLTKTVQSPEPSYAFPVGEAKKFHVSVALDGYIPLFGGRVGTANVDMTVQALGVAEKVPSLQAVESEVVDVKAVAFNTTLPLTKANIGGFFPKGTATFESGGVVKSNSVEAVHMPVQLPGLDSQRLPEVSYVPIVLDRDAVLAQKPYEFSRTFNGTAIKYKVTPGSVSEAKQTFTVEVDQTSAGFEDAYGNPSEEEKARSKLATKLRGSGTATFNYQVRMFDKVVLETNAETEVTNLKTGKMSTRNLKTSLTIVRDGAKVD